LQYYSILSEEKSSFLHPTKLGLRYAPHNQ
jgi:hypothetical protein